MFEHFSVTVGGKGVPGAGRSDNWQSESPVASAVGFIFAAPLLAFSTKAGSGFVWLTATSLNRSASSDCSIWAVSFSVVPGGVLATMS